ncbi:diguanylate cyclase [Laribacter hongkongensis]|uniref:Diguanylate cyclase n=1 Tax=Laribacter hongkongensis TaxID=168471 RepID=A0ABD4SNX1_9NEIS|nr:diguanylate cyclase [Laribacter hongkongensis]MCG9024998.1 diguanylate cyclase [Laribacter hongkongensis]MCG9100554.1 diguanylate cyclase [Laribacter hongkongensis]MCG9102280.1 diguanylate cyclase [Laribacter hongkongensis]MCG9111736.1 diguanylate cyclase [Laribacter hongkongensis]MCG9117778.1 diguanylate cyclase [Laribacter hongkongensis]
MPIVLPLPAPRQPRVLVWVAIVLGMAAVAWLSLVPARVSPAAPLVWWPVGVALAVMLRYGLRTLPALWLGLMAGMTLGMPAEPLLHMLSDSLPDLLVAGSVAVWGRWLLGQSQLPPWRQALPGLLLLVLLVLAGASVNCLLALLLPGLPHPLWREPLLEWWLADLLGLLVVGTLSMPGRWRLGSWAMEAERAAVLTIGVVSWSAAAWLEGPAPLVSQLVSFGFVPLVVWTAIRLTLRDVGLLTLLAVLPFYVLGVAPAGLEQIGLATGSGTGFVVMLLVLYLHDSEQQRHRQERLRRQEMRQLRRAQRDIILQAADMIPSAVVLTRLSDQTIVYANEALARLFGYPRASFIGRTSLEMGIWNNPDDRHELLARMHAPVPQPFNCWMRRADGTRFCIELQSSRVTWGDSAYMLTVAHDIDQLVRAESLARDGERSIKEALARAQIGYVDLDLARDRAVGNSVMAEMMGYPDDGAVLSPIPQDWIGRVHPDDRDMVRLRYRNLMAGRAPIDGLEFRLEHDRDWRWVMATLVPIETLPDGRALRVLGVYVDVTRLHLATAELRLAAHVQEHTPDAVLICDAAGRLLKANRAIQRLTGWAPEVLVEELLADLRADAYPVPPANRSWEGECHYRTLSGVPLACWQRQSPVLDEYGNLSYLLVTLSELSERQRQEARIRYLAEHDSLTGLYNRAALIERLGDVLAQARRQPHVGAVMYLDLDRFKQINDTLGHEAGDALLIEVARRIRSVVRTGDAVGRMGGDEFVVLLARLEYPRDAAAVADKLLAALLEPFVLSGQRVESPASIGVAMFPQDGEDADTLLRHADAAMYDVKTQGRGRWQFFTSALQSQVANRRAREAMLTRALERREFVLEYQLIYGNPVREPLAMEALLRWHTPAGERLPAQAFIDLAEDMRLALRLTRYTLDLVGQQLAGWLEAGLVPVPVAINLTSRQFHDPLLVTHVAETLREHRLDGQWIEFEVAESALFADLEQSRKQLARLAELGVGVAVDRFGGDIRRWFELADAPLTRIKVECSVLAELSGNDRGRMALSAWQGVLGRPLAVTGVESDDDLACAERIGSQAVQGWVCQAPLNGEQMAQILRQRQAREAGLPAEPPAAG